MWIYLKDYPSFQELEDSISHLENGSNPSHIAKSTHSVKASCCKECKKGICPMHQFGMRFEHYPLTVLGTKVVLTSSTEGFPAKIFQLQDAEKAWEVSEADYFSRSCAWPKKPSPRSYSLRTSQLLPPEGDFKSLERLPKWGMIVDGVLFPLHPLERYISVKGGSYWLTPSTMEHLPVRKGDALNRALTRGGEDSVRKCSGRLNEQVAYPQMWPTPSARDWKDKGTEPSAQNRKSPCLPAAVMMATPTAYQASKPIRAPSPSRQSNHQGEDLQDSIGRLNPETIGKRLNVHWVELLMGFPIGWTEISI